MDINEHKCPCGIQCIWCGEAVDEADTILDLFIQKLDIKDLVPITGRHIGSDGHIYDYAIVRKTVSENTAKELKRVTRIEDHWPRLQAKSDKA